MAKQDKWVSGETTEERFRAIAKNMDKFSRRLKTSVSLAVLPFPVSHYAGEVPSDGVVFRYIFPCKGNLMTAILSCAEKVADAVVFEATLHTGKDSVSRSTQVISQRKLEIGLKVEEGSTLEVKCLDAAAKGIHFGMTWAPSTDNYDIQKYLLDEIDQDQEELEDEE